CPRGVMRFSLCLFFFSSRRRHTRFSRDWSSDVCSSDLFDGRLTWANSFTKVLYYSYFRFSSGEEKPVLKFYSSIFLSHLNQEFIAHSASIPTIKNKHGLRLTVTSKLLIQGEEHHITSAFILRSPIDFIIGLEVKSCHLSITNQDGILLEGDLHQSLSQRLQSCFFSQVTTGGKKEGIG